MRELRLRRSVRISEISRQDLLKNLKYAQDISRYKKRLAINVPDDYSGLVVEDLLLRDTVTIVMTISDYEVTVSFEGFIEEIVKLVSAEGRASNDKGRRNITNLQLVIKALRRAYSKTKQVRVRCTCPDFIYRHAYWASKLGYIYGEPETRPAEKTNPKNDKGPLCKHLARLLSNGSWLVKLASTINNLFRAYPDIVSLWIYNSIPVEEKEDSESENESNLKLKTDNVVDENEVEEVETEDLEDEDLEEE